MCACNAGSIRVGAIGSGAPHSFWDEVGLRQRGAVRYLGEAAGSVAMTLRMMWRRLRV